jgi:hypothetical protein
MVEALAGKVSSGITHWVGVLNDLLASAGEPCASDPCTVELPAKTSGAITWTATITKSTVNGSVQYEYLLAGKDTASGTSATVVTATIQPGSVAGAGRGTLVIDYDAEKTLGLGSDRGWEHETGKVIVTYDNTSGLSLSIVVDKGQDASGTPRSASISLTFQQGASGDGGDLSVVIKYGASDEVDVTACWDATGEGRSDVKVQGEAVICPLSSARSTSASTVTREVVECWGPASACYTLQYFSASLSGGAHDGSFTYPLGATSDACTVPACSGGSTVGGGGGGGSDTGGGGGGGGGSITGGGGGGSDTGGGGGGGQSL